ncbi:MAG: prenyltransferase [Gammaproteobacteria bacterium]
MPDLRVPSVLHTLAITVRAARPGFLAITALGCLLGFAHALAAGVPWQWPPALLTVAGALLAHAASNLYNDYADALLGSDAINHARVTPFTGGARVIQDGALSADAVRRLAIGCGLAAAGIGLWIARASGAPIVALVAVGALLGWAYSHPPLMLMSRGLGELAVGTSWWLLVLGSDCVLRGGFSSGALALGAGYAALVAVILLVNEFPDRVADAAVGKRTAVVRLGETRAWALSAALLAGAHAWIAFSAWQRLLPAGVLAGLGSAPCAVAALARLRCALADDAARRDAIVLTLTTAALHAALLAGGLLLGPGASPNRVLAAATG